MKLEGYHNTESCNVESIMKEGFKYKKSNKHWLGQGIYFFADREVACANINMLKHDQSIETIFVEILVDDSQYLDLDKIENLNDFRKYWDEKVRELKREGKKLEIKDVDKKTANQIFRCLFLDAYKKEKDYKVVTKTFAKDKPPYGKDIEDIAYTGFPFIEKYICVSDDKYIVKKEVLAQTIQDEYIVDEDIMKKELFL